MVIGRSPRSVLICGPTGTGKTTLAKIYSQALLCRAPTQSGSPCLDCDNCKSFEADSYPWGYEFYPPSQQTTASMRDLVENIQAHAPIGIPWRVFFFDEAEDFRAWHVLRTEIERPTSPAAFIFAMIDPGGLEPQQLHRLLKIELAPADPNLAAELLARICKAEGAEFDPAALALIAAGTQSMREAIRDLEAVATQGHVTTDAVYETVLNARFNWVIEYFRAVAAGDLGRQLGILDRAPGSASEQAEVLQQILIHLQLRYVGPKLVMDGKRYSLIADADALSVLNCFDALARNSGTSLPFLWDGVLKHWADLPSRLTPNSFRTHAMRFHGLVSGLDPQAVEHTAPSSTPVSSPTVPIAATPLRLRRARSAQKPSDVVRAKASFLSLKQVEELYEASTFLLQAYGVAFNARIELAWREDLRGRELSELVSSFSHRLQMRVDAWDGGAGRGFARMRLQELRSDAHPVTTIVAHMPEVHQTRFSVWLDKQKRSGRWPAEISYQVEEKQTVAARIERHWSLVRGLWRGLDPSIVVGGGRALIDVLDVAPRMRREAGAIDGRRYDISEPISPRAQAINAQAELAHLSAFREQQWSHLFTGWEQNEHEERRKELAKRLDEKAHIERTFSISNALHEAGRQVAMKKMAKNQKDRESMRFVPWPKTRT